MTKYGKNRTMFYSCERYPNCTFSSWDLPTNEKCPKCGDMLLKKKGKNHILVCRNAQCDYKAEIPEEAQTEVHGGTETEE